MQLFERTLGEWLEYWVEKTPDKEFIVYSDRDLRFTYKQFDQRVNNLAKGLLSIGVTTGSHVGIWATNVPDATGTSMDETAGVLARATTSSCSSTSFSSVFST